ncbi:MAG: T9SS type A sorting domain-containing protein [Bacteroidota bacterium]
MKIGQYMVVSLDGRTAGDVLTYVSSLVTDNNSSNDELAKDLAEKVNSQQTIASGVVPLSSILYKGGSPRILWDFGTPQEFAVSQNYPNPFNPTTVIQYALPVDAHVSLKVYDVLGRDVQTLVNDVRPAGYHQTILDGTRISSGVYYYRLVAEGFSSTKRLLLLK